jgi:site-specific DNA recombinase
MSTRPAAIYVRISDDRVGGGLGVERQEKDCRAVAARLGWDVVTVHTDNDLTAYSKSRKYKGRPGYDALIDQLKNGTVRGVIAWHTDRLHRTPRELEDFIDIIENVDIPVETAKAGVVELRTPAGRAMARTLCAWAFYESEHKSERIRAKYVQLAEAGLPGNGGYRPFGYSKDRLSVVEEEADVLRECYALVLSGRSLRSICSALAERGILSSQGNRWTFQALRYNLLSARNAGLREHQGRIVGKAAWPAIVSEDTWRTAVAILAARSRQARRDGSVPDSGRRHLLTGFLWCGRCGGKLVPRSASNVTQRYGCLPVKEGGCAGSHTMISHTDAAIEQLLFAKLERDARLEPDAPPDPTQALLDRIAADELRLGALGDAFADDPDSNPLELRAAGARIRQRIGATRSELALAQTGLRVAEPLQVRAAWPGYDLAQKRAVIGFLIERVDVGPGTPGRFDRDRLDVTWR